MLHLLAWSSLISVTVVQVLWLPTFASRLQQEVFGDLIYLDCLLLPYLYFTLVPDILKKRWIQWPPRIINSVAPER
jgi:uncharacterized membrane protein